MSIPCSWGNPRELYYKVRSKYMGKRELLLIAAFIIAGAIVYQVSAPPPHPGSAASPQADSLRTFAAGCAAIAHRPTSRRRTPRRSTRGSPNCAFLFPSGELTIAGEDREDLGIELRVHSNGYDDAEAERLAKKPL